MIEDPEKPTEVGAEPPLESCREGIQDADDDPDDEIDRQLENRIGTEPRHQGNEIAGRIIPESGVANTVQSCSARHPRDGLSKLLKRGKWWSVVDLNQ